MRTAGTVQRSPWTAADLPRIAAMPASERDAEARREKRSPHWLRIIVAAWRALPADVQAVAVRRRWSINRVRLYRITLACADAAGVLLPEPTVRGMPMDESALSLPALRACFTARIRRLLPRVPFRGAERAAWIAGAVAVALGDVVTAEAAARVVRPARASTPGVRAVVRRAQQL